MDYQDLKEFYLEKKNQYGPSAYKQISRFLWEAKEHHRRDWERNPTPGNDHEQSWRAFKGMNLEKLIQDILKDEIATLGLEMLNGNKLKRSRQLPKQLSRVKRNLAIDYYECGLHLPDVDIVIYQPVTCEVLAVISSTAALGERVAQTGYWKLKLSEDAVTRHIKVYLVSPDEDSILTYNFPTKKAKSIVETDLDGRYVLTEDDSEVSEKVKLFEDLIDDLENVTSNVEQGGSV